MKRLWFLPPLALLTVVSVGGARADDEPEVRGRKASEWLEMLRGEQAEKNRHVALLGLGVAASVPAVWQPGMVQQRRAALIALELIGPVKSRQVYPALLTTLKDDPEEKIREGAAMALGRLGGRAVEEAKEAYLRNPDGDRKKTLPLSDVRDGLATALRGDKSPRVREACAGSLGKLEWSAHNAVPALAHALKDDSDQVRAAAVEALRRIGDEAGEALPALQDVLKDDKADALLRSLAAQAIGRLGKDADVDVALLLKVWHDPAAPSDVRADVADALGLLNRTAAASDLGAEMANAKNDVKVRRAAARNLDTFEGDAKPAIAQLRAALKDNDKFIRSLAMHTLGKCGRDLGDERRAVVKDLVAAIGDRVLEVRVTAIDTLAVLGPDGLGEDLPAVVERLTAAKSDGQKAVREAAGEALKKLGK
jgi:HEAT repeat protein